MTDDQDLLEYNGTTPVLFDQTKYYADLVGAVNNPLGGYINSQLNGDVQPRGAFIIDSITGNTIGDASGNSRTVTIQATLAEPLLLSPFIFAHPKSNAQGFYGVQNFNFVMNIGDTSRFWRTSKTLSSYTGYSVSLVSFTNSRLLFSFLTPHPEQALVSARNVVPYVELPRYLSTGVGSFVARETKTITSQSLQLNMINSVIVEA
jgi:hypothetical protein